MFGEVFTVICALLGIIGLMFISFWFAGWLRKKFKSGGFYGGQNSIKIVESVGIAQDKQLMIVTVGNKTMLLGVTSGSVSKICDLDETDIMTESEDVSAPSGFMQSLKKAFADKNRAAEIEENADLSNSSAENERGKKDVRNEKDDF